jgi:hypothetical protein
MNSILPFLVLLTELAIIVIFGSAIRYFFPRIGLYWGLFIGLVCVVVIAILVAVLDVSPNHHRSILHPSGVIKSN